MCGIDINCTDLFFEIFRRNLQEQRGDFRLVVDKNPGRRNADRIDTRHMRGRFFKGINNPLVVIHRVGIYFRIPNRLIAENGNAVDYRRHFAIAPAGIKPDPAAVQISPDRN